MSAFRTPSRDDFQRLKPLAKPFTAPKLVNPKEKVAEKPSNINLPIRGQ
jgi:hypothetical protein